MVNVPLDFLILAVFQAVPLLVHLLLYSIMILLTTGLSISAGLFIPNLIVGALWGRLFCIGLKYLFPHAVSIRLVPLSVSQEFSRL